MDETVENLVTRLCDIIEDGRTLQANDKALFLLDARSADIELEMLEERVEDLEYAAEDYYQLDKDDIETKMRSKISDQFLTNEGVVSEAFADDFDNDMVSDLVEDILSDILVLMEKENLNN